jgi:hypothetical protein
MILQLAIPALMAWAGWVLFAPPGVEWALSQTPFAVALAGWLLGDMDAVAWLGAHLSRRAKPVPPPVFLPADVVSLSDRRRRRGKDRRAA